jgi:hypothetical protein
MEENAHQAIRDCVARTFVELGVEPSQLEQMSDTLLIRDGHYCGRSYRVCGLMAMWLGGTLQFYGPDGELLKTYAVAVPQSVQSKAA